MAGRLTVGLSLNGAMVSRLIERARSAAHSSFCSSSSAPTSVVTALGCFAARVLGKMPTTSLRRLISPFRRSSGLVLCVFARCVKRRRRGTPLVQAEIETCEAYRRRDRAPIHSHSFFIWPGRLVERSRAPLGRAAMSICET